MRPHALLAVIVLCAGGTARAEGLSAGYPDCGGDALSSAQVVEHRPPHRGPLTAVPETLCADLAPQHPPTRIDIVANPILTPQVGPSSTPTPYDGRLPPIGRPLRPRIP